MPRKSRGRSRSSSSSSSSRSRSRSRDRKKQRRHRPVKARSRSKTRSESSRTKSAKKPPEPESKDSKKEYVWPDIMRRKDAETLRKRIFIANIRSDVVGNEDLLSIFSVYGKILGVNITLGGYGFVQFETEEQAQKAVNSENGNLLKGKNMAVTMALDNRKAPGRERSPVRGAARGRGFPPRGAPAGRGGPPGRGAPWPDPLHGYPPPPGRDPYPPDLYPPIRDPYPPIDDFHLRGYPPRDVRDLPSRELAARELALRDRREMLLDRARRDPYFDDPYRRLPPDPYYDRLLDDRLADPYRDHLPPPPAPKAPSPVKHAMECQIIIMSPQLRTYGEAVEKRVKNVGIFTEVIVLPPERTLQDAIDDVTSQSFLFAIVVSQQNEVHRSLTLNILHGKPQVHRNMPLEDCLTLVEKSFEKYLTKKKEKEVADKGAEFTPPDANTSYILHLIADSRSVNEEELDTALKYLNERRGNSKPLSESAKQEDFVAVEPTKPEVNLEEPSVVQQRAELQAKINNLFPAGSKAPAPKTSVTSLVNFDNPNVQKALDSLIQNPGVLQNIGNINPSNAAGMGGSPASSLAQAGPPASILVGAAGGVGMNSFAGIGRRPEIEGSLLAAQRAAQAQMFAATEHTQLARPPISMRFNRPM